MARAVADDCLAPAFIQTHPSLHGSLPFTLLLCRFFLLYSPSLFFFLIADLSPAGDALVLADSLLRGKFAIPRLAGVWGHNGAIRYDIWCPFPSFPHWY